MLVYYILYNRETDKLIEGADIVRVIKGQKSNNWAIYKEWTKQDQLDLKPMGTRPVGRPRQRWQEDVMEDLKKMKKTRGKQLRTEELGQTWLRRRKPTKGCSAK